LFFSIVVDKHVTCLFPPIHQTQVMEEAMLRSGVLPPTRFNMSESMSSSHGSFIAQHTQRAVQSIPPQQQQQQQGELATLLESIPSAGLEETLAQSPQQQQQMPIPTHQQQQQQQQQQFSVWAPQQGFSVATTTAHPLSSSVTTSAGAVGGVSPGASAASAGSSRLQQQSEGHSQPAAGAASLQQQVQQQQAQLEAMRLQQRQQEVLSQQQQQQGMNGTAAGKQLSLLSSADLEALLPLDSANAAAAAADGNQQPPAAAAALEQQNSFMLLLEGIDSLPMQMDSNIDALLNPSANPLLNEPMPQQYAAQQQQLQQQQVGSGGSPYTPAASAPAGCPHQQQQQGGEDGMGGLDIPDDYAAFLVDDDDLAAVGAEGAAGQRKRVRSGVGAGISSCSLDLRKLSDLLMGGSSMQLIEGSAWHKVCRSSFSRGGRSGPAALGGGGVGDDLDDACTAADAAAAAGSGVGDDEDDLHALLGLRDMSITR
jgi:hypothetical protein